MSRRYEVWADPGTGVLGPGGWKTSGDRGCSRGDRASATQRSAKNDGQGGSACGGGACGRSGSCRNCLRVASGFDRRLRRFPAAPPSRCSMTLPEYNQGAPPGLSPDAIAAQTRVITTVELGGSSHTLYVSPTTEGGFCYEWTGAAGGCDQFGTTPLEHHLGDDDRRDDRVRVRLNGENRVQRRHNGPAGHHLDQRPDQRRLLPLPTSGR